MSSNDDVYRTAGRGGAGNIHPKKDADNADKDLEKQELEAARNATPDSSAPAYSRAGRGGAGNFVDSSLAREQERQASSLTDKLKKHPQQTGSTGLAGRGGAGNYQHSTAAADEERAREERKKAEKGEGLQRKVKDQVETVLKLPEKVHHGSDKSKH